MKRALLLLVLAVALAVLLLPVVAAANPPPGEAGGGSGDNAVGSPEPLSTLLLLAGAAPTYLVYRRTRSRRGRD